MIDFHEAMRARQTNPTVGLPAKPYTFFEYKPYVFDLSAEKMIKDICKELDIDGVVKVVEQNLQDSEYKKLFQKIECEFDFHSQTCFNALKE